MQSMRRVNGRRSSTVHCLASAELLERRDCPAAVSIVGSRAVNEGVVGIRVEIRLSQPPRDFAAVTVVDSGSTASAPDYSVQGVIGRPLVFRRGEKLKTLTIDTVQDKLHEPTEQIRLSLKSPVKCRLANARSTTITIADDDPYSASMTGPALPTSEGQSAVVSIRLSSPAVQAEAFRVTARGETAEEGVDFARLDTVVTVPVGSNVATFEIPILADSVTEWQETLLVSATALAAGTPSPAPVRVVINTDTVPGFRFVEWSRAVGGNGHVYAFSTVATNWPEARRLAESLPPPQGFRSGTLASLTSEAENQFVSSQASGTTWMGFSSEAVDGEWRWIDGSPGVWQDPAVFANPTQTTYANWSFGEPSRSWAGSREMYGLFRWGTFTWNDGEGPGGLPFPFVVEFVPLLS